MSQTETREQAAPPLAAAPGLLKKLARHGYGLLAFLCVALWLPGTLSLPALDRDESRFAQSSRQMLESGNYVDIRFGQVPRYKKPVGIYWLQAGATSLASPLAGRDHVWTYRLPSLLGALAAVWLTFWIGSGLRPELGLVAALLMATSILLTAEATIATTDAVLLASLLAVQGVLLRVWLAAEGRGPPPSSRLVLMGWAAAAAGILVKFPIVPGVAIVTLAGLIIWTRQWRWLTRLKPLQGLLILLVLTMPWLIAIALQSHGAFFQQSLGNDFAAKVAGGQESHGAPPGYYLLLSALTFFPAILFLAPAIAEGWTRRRDPAIRFLIAWAGGWWILVELVPTKLPHYILPAYPALAILSASWLLNPSVHQGWRRALPCLSALQFLAGLAALVSAPILLPRFYGAGTLELARAWPLFLACGLAALSGLAAMILSLTGRRMTALAFALATTLMLVPLLTSVIGPSLSRLWVTERLGRLVASHRLASDPPPLLAGYQEPSLVFALGADVGLTDGPGAAELGARRGGLALIDDAEQPRFLARLAELGATADAVDDVSGFNYSRGRAVHVTLYRLAPRGAEAGPQSR